LSGRSYGAFATRYKTHFLQTASHAVAIVVVVCPNKLDAFALNYSSGKNLLEA
jgi:hypothetical protein